MESTPTPPPEGQIRLSEGENSKEPLPSAEQVMTFIHEYKPGAVQTRIEVDPDGTLWLLEAICKDQAGDLTEFNYQTHGPNERQVLKRIAPP